MSSWWEGVVMSKEFIPLSPREEEIASAIVDSAYEVHRFLGVGLLESVYEPCFVHALSKRGFQSRRQVIVPIIFDGLKFEEGFRLDVFVEEIVICELKLVE